MPKTKTKTNKPSPNPNFVQCGQGAEKGLKQRKLRISSRARTEIRFIACAAPIQVTARLDYEPVFEKELPDGDGSNEARYLLPGDLTTDRDYIVDWFYDSPVPIDEWATTTEVWSDGAVLFRHHKKADGNQPYRLGVICLEVI